MFHGPLTAKNRHSGLETRTKPGTFLLFWTTHSSERKAVGGSWQDTRTDFYIISQYRIERPDKSPQAMRNGAQFRFAVYVIWSRVLEPWTLSGYTYNTTMKIKGKIGRA